MIGDCECEGLSAYAIRHGGQHYPHDPGDLARCLQVSPNPPVHMVGRSPEWATLVEHWTELAGMLKAEHPSGTALKTYARMQELLTAARTPQASRTGKGVTEIDNRFMPGANWASKDGKRNIVIVADLLGYRGPAFTIRNLATGRESRIEISGLDRKFRFVGHDSACASRGAS